MFLGRVNVRETMNPCQVNQNTFHWKQTFAHAHFRKYSLRDHKIQSTWFLRRANGETFVAETKCFLKRSEAHFVSREKKCFRNRCFVRMQTEKHLEKHVSSTMFPQQRFLVCGALKSRHRKKRCYYLFTSCTVYLWILKKWKTDSAISCPTVLPVLVDFSLTTTSQNHMITVISWGVKQRQIKSSWNFKP